MSTQQKIDAFILKKAAWSKELNFLRKLLLETSLEETVKWGMPTYTLQGKNVIGIGAFKAHLGLWFFQGVFLKDKAKKLQNAQEGKTKAMRQWRFESMEELKENEKILKKYIQEAIKNQEAGMMVKPVRKKMVEMPEELAAYLKENPKVNKAFQNLKPGQQREYMAHIQQAKMEKTKLRRLEKITEMILEGKGLNDKYK